MATISNIARCPGGGHLTMTVTTEQGSRAQVSVSMDELRAQVEDTSVRQLIIQQLGSVVRSNPLATPLQLKTIIEARTFLE